MPVPFSASNKGDRHRAKTVYIQGFTFPSPEPVPIIGLGGFHFKELAPLDKRLAVLETLAHLEAMRIDGRVEKLTEDSIIYYQRI